MSLIESEESMSTLTEVRLNDRVEVLFDLPGWGCTSYGPLKGRKGVVIAVHPDPNIVCVKVDGRDHVLCLKQLKLLPGRSETSSL